MVPSSCSPSPSYKSIPKFISEHPYLSMLEKKCTTMKDLQTLHAQLIKDGLAKEPVAASRVLAFCTSSSGDINYAYSLFKQIKNPNTFMWNTMIRGFSQSSTPHRAISLFIDMLVNSPYEPQKLTYPSVFKAYSIMGLANEGVQLHGRVIKLGLENDEFIRNTILHMYTNGGHMCTARRVFDRAKDFDIVAWNIMIMGHSKHGEIDESRELFDHMVSRNTVSWNSMISGYVRIGRFVDALDLFSTMQEVGVEASEFTMVSLLNACACLGAIRQGEWIHDYIIRNNFELNPIVVTAIIDMYCKCGNIDKALHVFESTPQKGLSCWNSMILGLAMNGHESKAMELFSKLKTSKLEPDHVSFVALLTACNHSGSVEKAKEYFLLMTEEYKIEPQMKHYSCMIDVLGRAGLLEEAEELIRRMPIDPDAIIWGSLLSSCRKYGNLEIAKRAAKRVLSLDPNESSIFVLLSNLYASCKNFESAIDQRLSLKQKQMEKQPGCSFIEVNGEVHEFVAGGRLHPQAKKIYCLLNCLEC